MVVAHGGLLNRRYCLDIQYQEVHGCASTGGRGQSWFGYDLGHRQSPVGVRSFSLGGGAKLALQEGGDVEVSIELGPMKAKPGGRNLYVGQGFWRGVG